jgi:TPR repeat protein
VRRVRSCRDADAVALGVKPALRDAVASGGLPTYVLRDIEVGGSVDPATDLAAAFAVGGLVIIEGPSAAGKTRTAFEAMRRYAPDRWLIVPDNPASLLDLKKDGVRLSHSVVWLDDIDSYLLAVGLDAAVLDAFCHPDEHDVIMLGTLRSEARIELAETSAQDSAVRRSFGEISRRARFIGLDREFSQAETQRATAWRTADSRVAAALDHSDSAGFAEYLAAAPAVLERWHSARRGEHPVAGAIISAAIDTQMGFLFAAIRIPYLLLEAMLMVHGRTTPQNPRRPVPASMLEELYTAYLLPLETQRPGQPGFRDALNWAVRPVNGASSCLLPTGDDTYQVFEYLLDHVSAGARSGTYHPLRDVPAAALQVILTRVDAYELAGLESELRKAGRYDMAESAYQLLVAKGTDVTYVRAYKGEDEQDWLQHAAEAGQPSAMCDLAVMAFRNGDRRQAGQLFRRAAELGSTDAMNNLGVLREIAGDFGDAEQWYRRAARRGHPDAMNNLAICLHAAGRSGEAAQWWSRAASEDEETALRNQRLAQEPGDVSAGRTWYRKGPETWTLAQRVLKVVAGMEEGEPDAGPLLREAAGAGDRMAMIKLASICDKTGDATEATRWYRRAAEAGDADAMTALGARLYQAGANDEAETWWRAAAAHGDAMAMYDLAVLFQKQEDDEQARAWRQQAVDAGYPDAMLAAAAATTGEESELCWFRAAQVGETRAMLHLGFRLYEAGQLQEAEPWLWRAASAGETGAMLTLAMLLHQEGREEEARTWATRGTREAIQSSAAPRSLHGLGGMLLLAGRSDQAEQLWRRAAQGGSIDAVRSLRLLLTENDEMRASYQTAVEAGDSVAAAAYGLLLHLKGHVPEAECCYERAAAAGITPAMFFLGNLLREAGRGTEAEQWWRRAASDGQLESMVNLGALLHRDNRSQEAAQFWEHAAAEGNPEAMNSLGTLASKAGDDVGAAIWWRRAAEAGHIKAMGALGLHHYTAGRFQDAERWWRRAAESGDPGGAMGLTLLLRAAGNDQEAEPRLRQAAEAGETEAMFELGSMLYGQGREEGAATWWHRAADAGHVLSMANVGAHMANAGLLEEGEAWLRRAVDSTHGESAEPYYSLGQVLQRRGNAAEAEHWYRKAAEAGIPDAAHSLAWLLNQGGRTGEAERWYRQAAEAGITDAMARLAGLLKDAGDTAGAETWYRRAVAGGDAGSATLLGFLVWESGRDEEAAGWFRQAAAAGDEHAMNALDLLLDQTGHTGEAEH